MAGGGPHAGSSPGGDASSVSGPPSRVTFPAAFRNQANVESLKLEVEESTEAMSPSNMWQVYALGGFMVLKWLWARCRERRDGGASA